MQAVDSQTFYGLLFWRSFQQLIGGLGIILMVVALLPQLRVAGLQLYRAETVGPSKDTITPRAASTARILWRVYLLLNGLEIILLYAAGMPLYDAVCTAFSTLATGGFSPQASSLAAYHSPLIEAIVAIFIVIGMSSLTLHYRVLTSDRLAWLRDEEFRFMLIILAAATAILIFFGGIDGGLAERFRFASFQVISFMGTCGFVSSLDYDKWSTAAKLALIMVMLIGGCIGSTAGGIKVGRLLVCCKHAYNELMHMLHPHALMSVRLGEGPGTGEHTAAHALLLLLLPGSMAGFVFGLCRRQQQRSASGSGGCGQWHSFLHGRSGAGLWHHNLRLVANRGRRQDDRLFRHVYRPAGDDAHIPVIYT